MAELTKQDCFDAFWIMLCLSGICILILILHLTGVLFNGGYRGDYNVYLLDTDRLYTTEEFADVVTTYKAVNAKTVYSLPVKDFSVVGDNVLFHRPLKIDVFPEIPIESEFWEPIPSKYYYLNFGVVILCSLFGLALLIGSASAYWDYRGKSKLQVLREDS